MKTLFSKYFMMTTALLLLSFIILGGGLGYQVYKYAIVEKQESLTQTASNIADMADDFILDYKPIREQLYQNILGFISNIGSMHVLIADSIGQIVMSSDDARTGYVGGYISPTAIRSVLENGTYSEIGTLDGMYKGQNYSVGLPVKNDAQIIGFVFVTVSADSMASLLGDVLKMFVLSAILVFLIAALSCYVIIQNMTRPIKAITGTVKAFEHGDYTARVPRAADDEIGELTVSFNKMADAIEKSEELRRGFVANVSHELRSPMTSIGGFVDGILDGTIPPERQNHYLSIISGEVKRLTRLVSSMLDITRLQATDMRASAVSFDFCALTQHAVAALEGRVSAKLINMRVSLSAQTIEITANEDALFQVVYNLIDNSIKFSPKGETISIFVEKKSGKLSFRIQNRGSDIPVEEQNYIFDRFHKVDRSRGNDKTGLGLGLYIAKTIVSQHDGDIGVRSQNGITEFYFSIPERI